MAVALAALRSALFVLWMTVTVVPVGTAVVVCSPFLGADALYAMCMFWVRLAAEGSRVICGVRRRVRGLENLPGRDQPEASVILASKHQSTWETFTFPMIMPHPLAYVFKRELIYIPFFGWAMGQLDMIHIDRRKRAEAWSRVAAQGRRLAARGKWVIMFPEGTRTPRGQKGSYKAGAARLAVDTGVPIVPIAVSSARCWPRRSFLLRPGVVDISIGRPISPAGRQADELMREVEAWIEAEMRVIDPEAYAATEPAAARAAA